MTLTLDLPKYKSISENEIKWILETMLSEYSEFDLHLLKKYYETVNLNNDNFTNIQWQ